MKQTHSSNIRDNILPHDCFVFDSGFYIHVKTGLCLSPEELDELKASSNTPIVVEKSPQTGSYDEWIQKILDLLILGRETTQEGMWTETAINPDDEIGQTVPYDEYNYETVQVHGIESSMPREDYYTLRGPGRRRPNCVDIERTRTPIYSDRDLPSEVSKEILLDLMDSLYKLFLALRSTPNDKSFQWIAPLIDFTLDNIVIQGSNGEIGIIDLLSVVEKNEKLLLMMTEKIHIMSAENTKLRKKIKSLRTFKYGHKKSKLS